MKSKVYLLQVLITFLVCPISSVKVQCQHQVTQWKTQRFQLNEREVLVPTIYEGVSLFVDSKDGYVSRFIINSGRWQPRSLRNMARFVEPGYTMLNVGSHVGIESVVLGKALGENGRLFMFQPLSVTHNLALKNVHFNGLGDIATVYHAGGGSSYSKAIEVINIKNTGGSRIYTSQTSYVSAVDPNILEQVTVDAVDDVLPSDVVINFVLIDAERMQLDVLNGMKNTILRSPDIIIFCEWAGNYFKQTGEMEKMADVVNWFVEQKFKFYEMRRGEAACQYATWVEQTAQQIMGKKNYPDILFVPSHIDPNKVGL